MGVTDLTLLDRFEATDLSFTLDLTGLDAPTVDPERLSTVELFGISVDALTMSESVDRAELLVKAHRPAHHVCVNAAKVVAMQSDERLRASLADADMVNVDGQSIVWASRWLRGGVPERVAGIDFMEAMVERAADRGWPVYFLGATDHALAGCVKHFTDRFPGLIVAGSRDGYWSDEEQPAVLRSIAESGAAVVFVAMPTPRKEYLVSEHLDEFGNALVVGVGGSFDVFAGLISRAPKWARSMGLEWAHRLVKEPRRMWKRYLVGNTLFCLQVARCWWQVRVHRGAPAV
ncbi:MAG: N-acetylglucosaminyldiphosphoundecaprenol N-acetyl-beta-D-mannosaminyltransferase [Actinomycetota bacterium]